jgi:hypothetical protein
MFLTGVASGEWLHVHAAYLPLAQVLTWLPGVDGTLALQALAVLSGTACVVFSTLLASRASHDMRVMLVVGLLVGFAPVVWAASGMVEIHVFAGAGACVAAWIACTLPGPAWRRGVLAAIVGLLAHMTNVLLVPLFVALALERTPRERLVRDGTTALAAVGLAVIAVHLVARELPPKVAGMSNTPLLLAPGERAALARDPDRDWAVAVAAHVDENSVVLCLGPGRKMRIDELTIANAVDFRPAGDHWDERGPALVEGALAGARERGQTLFLDPEVLGAVTYLDVLRPVVDTLREVAILTQAADGNLLRIE